LAPAKTDPVSGQPALKMALVSVEPVHTAMYGFFVARDRPDVTAADYWAVAQAKGGLRGELGFLAEPADWDLWVRAAFGLPAGADLVSAVDARSGRRKYMSAEDGRLQFAVYLSPDPVLVSRQWVVDQLALETSDGHAVIAGRPGAGVVDAGAIVCACESVGIVTITDAVVRQGCTTVEAVGACTGAGTNCGSCRAEIRAVIGAHRLIAAE
jgi:assimilatory nitrate reductase catalytic subunit